MRRPEFIANHSRCPSGLLGSVVARVMAHETAADNRTALEFLEIRRNDSVLEIGFGHGRTIAAAAALAFDGRIAGVEISERMLRMASRYNKKYVEIRRVDLKLSNGRTLPYGDSCFDRAFSVHTVYFWPRPLEYFQEIVRVLKPGGRFVLGFRPGDDPETRNFPESVYRFYTVDEVQALLRDAGFREINMVRGKSTSEATAFAVCEASRGENGACSATTAAAARLVDQEV